jgi:hypothetical protein
MGEGRKTGVKRFAPPPLEGEGTGVGVKKAEFLADIIHSFLTRRIYGN